MHWLRRFFRTWGLYLLACSSASGCRGGLERDDNALGVTTIPPSPTSTGSPGDSEPCAGGDCGAVYCTYNDKGVERTYPVGEMFHYGLDRDCLWCVCLEDGTVDCRNECAGCVSGGVEHAHNATWDAGDGGNTCECVAGNVLCTAYACSCSYAGASYNHGEPVWTAGEACDYCRCGTQGWTCFGSCESCVSVSSETECQGTSGCRWVAPTCVSDDLGETGQCVPATQCDEDQGCPPNQVCRDVAIACTGGAGTCETCDETEAICLPVIAAPNACVDDGQCPLGEVCGGEFSFAGECEPQQCPPEPELCPYGLVCDPGSNVCVLP